MVLAADEPRVLCIIKNANNPGDTQTVNLPVSTPCSQLIADVGNKLHLPADAFELVFELPLSSNDGQRQVLLIFLAFEVSVFLCVLKHVIES